MKKKILVTPSAFEIDFVSKNLKKFKDIKFIYKKGPIVDKNLLIRNLKNCDSAIIGSENIDKEVIEKCKKLKSITRFGTSIENIDVLTCRKNEIKIYKLSNSINSNAVARHVLALILCLSHNIKEQILSSQKNEWKRFLNLDQNNLRIGIFGMGHSGKKITKLLLDLGYQVFYFSRKTKYRSKKAVYLGSLKKLIKKVDVLSIHVSSNSQTKKIIDNKVLKLLKNKYIINTSRGDLIDEKALYKYLKSKYILGAGLDVYKNEPSIGISGKIRNLSNVIGTAHSAFFDKNTILEMTNSSLVLVSESLKKIKKIK